MDIQTLTDDWVHQIKSAKDITKAAADAGRPPTPEEQANITKFMAAGKSLETQIQELRDAEALVKSVDAELAKFSQPMPGPKAPPVEPLDSERHTPVKIEYVPRCTPVKNFHGPNANEDAYRVGRWLTATFFKNQGSLRWCREHGMPVNVHTEGVNTAGGFVVPDEMSNQIIVLRNQFGVFRQNTRVLPMGRDLISIPRWGTGLTAGFANESALPTETDMTLQSVQLVAKKMGAWTRMSTELAEDAFIDMADLLTGEIAYAMALLEDTVGFVGAGTAAHGSIVGAATLFTNDNTLAGAVDPEAADDTFAEITAIGLANVMAALPAYAKPRAKWYCSETGYELMFARLQATAGGNTVQTLSDGRIRRSYLGYEIVTSEAMTSVTTSLDNTTMALFGDLALASTMGERRGITMSVTDQRYWDADQIGLKATERIDINVHDVGDATTAGPIVALIGVA